MLYKLLSICLNVNVTQVCEHNTTARDNAHTALHLCLTFNACGAFTHSNAESACLFQCSILARQCSKPVSCSTDWMCYNNMQKRTFSTVEYVQLQGGSIQPSLLAVKCFILDLALTCPACKQPQEREVKKNDIMGLHYFIMCRALLTKRLNLRQSNLFYHHYLTYSWAFLIAKRL